MIKTASATHSVAPPLPAIEYRLTYVPTKFTYTQICVRAFFCLTSLGMLVAYSAAICGLAPARREYGQVWVTVLLVLLIALNDPLYIARVMVGGNQLMYTASVMGQILFSGGLFLFWLVRKAHMRTRPKRDARRCRRRPAWRHRSPSVLSFRPLRTCSAPAPRLTRPPPPAITHRSMLTA